MHRALSLLPLALACAGPAPVDRLPAELQAPPGFDLDVSAVMPGQPMTLTARGLAPGAPAFFLVSPRGPGPGDCAPNGAFCLDIRPPNVFLSRRTADATGTATLTLTVPASVPPEVWFQAGTMSAGVGATSAVVSRLAGDGDLDGVLPPGDCDDTDPAVAPGAAEVCGDGIDNDCMGGDEPCNTPPVVGGITRIDPSDIDAMVTWSAATDAESASGQLSYAIYASTTPGGQDLTSPDLITSPGATQGLLTGLTPDTDLYVVVQARDPQGLTSAPSVEATATTLTLEGAWGRDLALDSPLVIDAPCFGTFTADIGAMSLTFSGDGYAATGAVTGRSFTDNAPHGGGLSSDAVMTGGTWVSDLGRLTVTGATGTVQNTDCDGGFFCNFACALNGGFFDMSVGAGGQADGQVSQFDYPSPTDTSGATGLRYVISTDGVNEFLTVLASEESPPRPDQHFFR